MRKETLLATIIVAAIVGLGGFLFWWSAQDETRQDSIITQDQPVKPVPVIPVTDDSEWLPGEDLEDITRIIVNDNARSGDVDLYEVLSGKIIVNDEVVEH